MPGETRDEVRRPYAGRRPPRRARRPPRAHPTRLRAPPRPAPMTTRDLAARRLGEAPGELVGAPANDLLEALRQLAADCDRTLRQRLGERAEARGQPARRLEGDQPRRAIRTSSAQSAARALSVRGRYPTNWYRSPDEPARDERRLHRGRARAAPSPAHPSPAPHRSDARPGRSPRAGLRRSSARPARRPRAWAASERSAPPRCARGS